MLHVILSQCDSVKGITIIGCGKRPFICMDEHQKANELDVFYCRFETEGYSQQCNMSLGSIPCNLEDWKTTVEKHEAQS